MDANDPIDNVLVQANVLNTPNAYYCFNFPGDKIYSDSTTNTRMVDNIYGNKYNPACGWAGPITGSHRFTIYSGNSLI